ncbi:hypothetical protein F7725_009630, partial [Dissostichus mawsoni]
MRGEMEWGVSGRGWLNTWGEVEQGNAFLSRIAVTTKHMSKAGRTDMLTLLAMRWNQQKINNLATSLSHRYQKHYSKLWPEPLFLVISGHQSSAKPDVGSGDHESPIGTTTTKTTTNDADALASRIEVLVASIKRRSQRLYKVTDGNKAHARIRCKIRKEKEILTSVVESYNRMVPSTETLCLENILSEEENAWPWQLPHSDSVDLKPKRRAFDIVNAIRRLQEEKKIVLIEKDHHWRALQTRGDGLKELSCLLSSETMQNFPWVLSEEGLRGLQSTILRKRQNITERKLQARACYLQVLSGAENGLLLLGSWSLLLLCTEGLLLLCTEGLLLLCTEGLCCSGAGLLLLCTEVSCCSALRVSGCSLLRVCGCSAVELRCRLMGSGALCNA